MRILIVAKQGASPYTDELTIKLGSIGDNIVACNLEMFWSRSGDFDIIHLHWPELLTKWKQPTEYEILFLKDIILPYWKKKSKIVVTRHNIFPHYRNTETFKKLYEIIYSFADGVIHMGNFCYKEFEERYSYLKNFKYIKRTIISHHIFTSYPNHVDLNESRKKLNIKKDKFVILFPGSFRHKEEADLLFNVFNKVKIKNKVLICFRWWDFNNEPPKKELKKWLLWKIRVIYTSISPKYNFSNLFIENEEIQNYMNAANLIVIPRKHILNSGIAFLSFAFDKFIVGPKTGNLTEVLEKSNNYTYNPDIIATFVKAVEKSAKVSKIHNEKGSKAIKEIADLNIVVNKHEEFYNFLKA